MVRKIIKRLAPLGGAIILSICAYMSLRGYEAPIIKNISLETVKGDVAQEEESETEDKVVGNFNLEDKVYEGVGMGYKGQVRVAVTIKNRNITDIEILENHDDKAFFYRAQKVVEDIVQQQSWDVDVVSGATYSSTGIKNAVENALTGKKDQRKAQEETKRKKPQIKKDDKKYDYKDGTFRGQGQGFAGPVIVDVTIKKAKIKKIKIVKHSDGQAYMQKAKRVAKRIIEQQSTSVDVEAGATYSSAGIINGVSDALKKARIGKKDKRKEKQKDDDNKTEKTGRFEYADGVYRGIGQGFKGDIVVDVEIKSKTIKIIEVVETHDDAPFFGRAQAVLQQMIDTQSIQVDVVSGATFSSRGLIEAVTNALNPDKNDDQNKDDEQNKDDNIFPEIGNYQYEDGEYTGTALCMPDDNLDFEPYNITVQLAIKDDRIISIPSVTADYIDYTNDTYFYWAVQGKSKLPGIPAQILDLANVSQIHRVDAISNATCSSIGITEACQNAILKAKKK